MANKHKGEVSLKVDKKDYTLRLTFSKVAELEGEGVNLFEGANLSSVGVQLKLFYVLVKGQNGIETIEDADELLMNDYTSSASAVGEAVSLFFQRLTPKETTATAKS